MTEFQDQTITCRDCGNSFVFSAGEQAFFAEKEFNAPTRCKVCRQQRKLAQNGPQAAPVPVAPMLPEEDEFHPKKKSKGQRRARREEEDW